MMVERFEIARKVFMPLAVGQPPSVSIFGATSAHSICAHRSMEDESGGGKPSTLVTVDVEVCLHSTSTARPSEIRDRVRALLEASCGGRSFLPGPVPAAVLRSDELVARHVLHARICEIIAPDARGSSGSAYLPSVDYFKAVLQVCVAAARRGSWCSPAPLTRTPFLHALQVRVSAE